MKIGIDFGKTGEQFVENFAARPVKAVAKSSREWAGELAKDRNPFFFSAKCSDAKLLEAMKHYIERDLAGDPARGRLRFVKDFRRLQGVPLNGEDSNRMTDLRSSRRLKLIYDFHAARVQAEEKMASVDNDDHRIAFPYRELYRPGSSHPKAPRNWLERCRSVGFEILGGRIFAPRDSVLWREINRFGFDHPPFDFNSGMDVRYVSRAEARELGLKLPKIADVAKNPEAMDPEVEKRELERRDYYGAPKIDADEQRRVLAQLGRPGIPLSAEEAKTLPLEDYVDPDAFEDAGAGRVFAERRWNAAAKANGDANLSPRQVGVVKRFTDNSRAMNEFLRGNEDVPASVKRDAREMEEILKDSSFGTKIETVRTASVPEAEAFLGLDMKGDYESRLEGLLNSGEEKTFKTFMSTSMFSIFRPQGLKTRGKLGVEYRVMIPKGSPAMFLDNVSTKGPYGLSGSLAEKKAPPRFWSEDGRNTESEIVIAPGQNFVVRNYRVLEENGLKRLVVWLSLAM